MGLRQRLQNAVFRYYAKSNDAGYDWAGRTIAAAKPEVLLDVGCGDGARLFGYLAAPPRVFCGLEGHEGLAQKARARGIDVRACDLNGVWPFDDHTFDAVHCAQVIEHVHNTRMFLAETFRVLRPGGLMVMTSENLSSLLNVSALMLGYAPFSLQSVCGWYIGNPFGLHAGEPIYEEKFMPPLTHPAFAGITGHIRVLTVTQAQALLERIGFADIRVFSTGLMPLPRWLGKALTPHMPRRGHWLHLQARKPPVPAASS